jgi:hypothetical protein
MSLQLNAITDIGAQYFAGPLQTNIVSSLVIKYVPSSFFYRIDANKIGP